MVYIRQGSVLCPSLFLAYVNGLNVGISSCNLRHSKLSQLADDTTACGTYLFHIPDYLSGWLGWREDNDLLLNNNKTALVSLNL